MFILSLPPLHSILLSGVSCFALTSPAIDGLAPWKPCAKINLP